MVRCVSALLYIPSGISVQLLLNTAPLLWKYSFSLFMMSPRSFSKYPVWFEQEISNGGRSGRWSSEYVLGDAIVSKAKFVE